MKDGGIRKKFVKAFGEKQATFVEKAANYHANGINSECKGDDPFKWALLICIGYQCCEKGNYRKYHGITAPWAKIKAWIKKHGQLNSHVGDCDYLALLCGTYNEFMPKQPAKRKSKEAA